MSQSEPTAQAPRRLVFISHSSKDTWVARQIARLIVERGAEVFLDDMAIEAGDDFTEVIRLALLRADELVVLWTPWALDRSFVLTEVAVAWSRLIPIVQVLYGVSATELQAHPNLLPFLKVRDMLRIEDLDSYLDQLETRVRQRGIASGDD